jgi:acyl carrier protein
MSATLFPSIREVIREHAGLSRSVDEIDNDANLFEAGLSSMATVSVMLALEDAFDVEFPESMLSRATFESIGSIASAIESFRAS